MNCPLCDHKRTSSSWFGSTSFNGREFHYLQCLLCGSHFYVPMPDNETLALLYGQEYFKSGISNQAVEDPKEQHRVIEWLNKVKPGTFIDYGCGSGDLLREARILNWQAIGVEFDKDVAKSVEERTRTRVLNRLQVDSLGRHIGDVLHLGDVIEHLTDVNREAPKILRLIKPGGLLIAQGPLEGNPNLFYFTLYLAHMLRRSHRSENPPYHVILASLKGQKEFFRRFGLKELEFSVREVSWPVPERLSFNNFREPRTIGLFVLRRVSQMASKLLPNRWGNRYFYVGCWDG